MTTSDLDLTMNDIRFVVSEMVWACMFLECVSPALVERLDEKTRQANEQSARLTRELAEAQEALHEAQAELGRRADRIAELEGV